MALLQLLSEETIPEDHLQEYFENLYKITCVSERPASCEQPAALVRATYIVDWEQLVHLLEDYTVFGEDIVEVARVTGEEAKIWRMATGGRALLARA